MTIEPNTISTMPVLALRGLTIFPNMLLHFDVGRGASIKALDEAMTQGLPIFLVAQRDLTVEEPGEKDLFTVGTVSSVKQILRLPGDNVRVMVEGSARGRLVNLSKTSPFLQGEVEVLPVPEHTRNTPKTEALIRSTYELFERYAELSPRMTGDVLISVLSSEDPGYIADYIAQNIAMRASDKQAILEELQPVRRLTKLAHALSREVSILELGDFVRPFGGLMYPAHVDRDANGLFAMLGVWPEELRVPAVEIRHILPPGVPDGLKTIMASDAHRLMDLPEGGFPLPLKSPDFAGLAAYLGL